MHVFRTGQEFVSRAALLAAALFAAACGGVTNFQGASAFTIAGTPPPPPPPPPKAEEPPPPPARVEVRSDKIEIKEKIQFEYNKAVILPASFSLLDEIADTIKKNPHIKKINIEGHASAEGDPGHNLKLSDERANSVRKYLVDKGVEATRLTAKGFGAKRPIASNDTDEGKEKNRRVEFMIAEQDVTQKKVEVDHTGKEKVVEEKKVTETKEEPASATDDKKTTEAAKKLPAPKRPAPPTATQ
ncbi:MAG TPA: OmpA family protein [Polyangiaceae bacterium]